MDRSRLIPRLFFPIAAILALLGAAVRTVSYLTAFDTEVGYLDPGPWTTLTARLYLIVPIVLIVMAIAIPKNTLSTAPSYSLRMVAAIPMAVVLIAFVVASFLICKPAEDSMLLAIVLLSVPSALYYVLSSVSGDRSADWVTMLGFIPAIWCITAVADLYFDQFVTMNSPIKVSLQTGLLGFTAAVLSELRFRIGRSLPRVALFFFGLSGFTCLTAAIPLLVATGAHVLDHPLHLMYATVLLVAGLYSLYLLFLHTRLPLAAEHPDSVSELPDKGGAD